MSKGKGHGHGHAKGHGQGHKDDAAVREERRKAQFAAMQQRASAASAPSTPREHIQGIDVEGNEQKYEPLLFAIETGLVQVYQERDRLPVDDEAERALRLVIARFEGDSGQRTGSRDVDAMADAITHNVELLFRRGPLLARTEIVGCVRRIITSLRDHHDAVDPRAYLEFVSGFVSQALEMMEPRPPAGPAASGLWVPGQERALAEPRQPSAPAPSRRPGGLWLPGDEP